jgi:hypothetical protein
MHVVAGSREEPSKIEERKIASATTDANPPEAELNAIYDDKSDKRRVTGPIEYAIDGKDETAWGIEIGPGRSNVPRKAVFVLETPVEHSGGASLTLKLKQNHGGWNSDDNQNNNLGRFRFSVTDAVGAEADPLPAHVRTILNIPAEKRSPAEQVSVFGHWRTTVPEWKEAKDRIEALWREHPSGGAQLVLHERSEPRPSHMLQRGNFLKPGDAVTPGVPEFLHPMTGESDGNAPRLTATSTTGDSVDDVLPTRLEFARWLADRRSPTTARAIVNRIWQTYFGTGIVATSEDLGIQSETPSHPELLDWLAVELMDRGWSIKTLHRRIVTSAAYRQTSTISPELLERDPYNRLAARGPRVRVEGEIVRDVALAASGLLTRRMGGPSVHPPAPDFLFVPPASYGPKTWKEDQGADRYRRALYTFRFRSVPYPTLEAFDTPNGDASCVRRARSNTPLQALVTLNEPLFVECAQSLALVAVRASGDDRERLHTAFRRCLTRAPSPQEEELLLKFLDRQKQRFADGQLNPWDLAPGSAEEPPPMPEETSPAELAAWTALSRVLLNLDETITKE